MFRDKRFEVVCSDGKHRTETVKDLLLIIHILCTTQTVPLPIVRLVNPLNFQSSHQPAVLLRCQLFHCTEGARQRSLGCIFTRAIIECIQ